MLSLRRSVLSAAAVAALGFVTAAPAAAASDPAAATTTGPATAAAPAAATPDSSHGFSDVRCSNAFYQNDPRLGPRHLPTQGPVGNELAGYHRTGYLTTSQFLDDYFNPATNSYIFPPSNGFALDSNGNPISFVMQLVPGQQIDRYGSEAGGFLAPEGTPFAQRALPPQSLDSSASASCSFHEYRVLKPFSVVAGPAAPWFAQSGGGLQFQLKSSLVPNSPDPLNVLWLVQHGYLQPTDGVLEYAPDHHGA